MAPEMQESSIKLHHLYSQHIETGYAQAGAGRIAYSFGTR